MYILIIEDEIPAFEKLCNHLKITIGSDFRYDWARSNSELHHFLKKNSYQLIISDIQLLDGISFEVFETVNVRTPIIFCSAYDEYLFKAFQSNGIAYILKPYTQSDIAHALSKFKTLFQAAQSIAIPIKVFSDLKDVINNKSISYKERFVIKRKKGIHLLETDVIVLIEAQGDFCKLIDMHGKTHLYSLNIGGIYDLLDPSKFFRINRSQLVQLQYIQTIENHFKNRLLLTLAHHKEKVMTSSTTTANFRLWLDQ